MSVQRPSQVSRPPVPGNPVTACALCTVVPQCLFVAFVGGGISPGDKPVWGNSLIKVGRNFPRFWGGPCEIYHAYILGARIPSHRPPFAGPQVEDPELPRTRHAVRTVPLPSTQHPVPSTWRAAHIRVLLLGRAVLLLHAAFLSGAHPPVPGNPVTTRALSTTGAWCIRAPPPPIT